MAEGRQPELLGLPEEADRWWGSRLVRAVFFGAVALAVVLVAIALIAGLKNDFQPITLMLSVYGCLFLAWLAFAGHVFDLSLKAWQLLVRTPVILAACALLLVSPLVFLALQPARFVRSPRIGAGGRTYREFGFRSRRALAARRPWLLRLPAAAHVVTGRMTLSGPQSPDPAETVRWPFFLSRYDRRPGLFPRRRDVDLIGHGGAALPQILLSLMARGTPDGPGALLLLTQAPREVLSPLALDGGDPAGVHPVMILPSERDFVCDELVHAGYDDQMIVGRLQDSAELIAHAWRLWRHRPVAAAEGSAEQVA